MTRFIPYSARVALAGATSANRFLEPLACFFDGAHADMFVSVGYSCKCPSCLGVARLFYNGVRADMSYLLVIVASVNRVWESVACFYDGVNADMSYLLVMYIRSATHLPTYV